MKAYRLFYKVGGAFADRQVLAKVPTFVQPGKKYAISIEAEGPHIQIFVDGVKIIDLRDGTFAEGHFGVNVFGGVAYYQNVYATHLRPADLRKTSFVSSATNKLLYAAKSQNGEPVTLGDPESGAVAPQTWVLVPTGDEQGSYSIRTSEGKALDYDTGQNKLQLYDYLGYDNQRWLVRENGDGTVTIVSMHLQKALEASKDGGQLFLSDLNLANEHQKWQVEGMK